MLANSTADKEGTPGLLEGCFFAVSHIVEGGKGNICGLLYKD